MKDSEFIELLNLYLDHEISAADAARLEAEVQTNAARQRVYLQYCRMQKACKMVAADFQTASDEADVAAEKKIVAFTARQTTPVAVGRQRTGPYYWAGSLAAAAACVAVIFTDRSRPEAPLPAGAAAAPVLAQIAPAVPKSDVQAVEITSSPSALRGMVSLARRPQPTLVADPLLLTGNSHADAVFAAAVEQANSQLAWIETVRLSPLQTRVSAQELHFGATLRPEGRALGQRAEAPAKSAQPAEEMVTFQFVK